MELLKKRKLSPSKELPKAKKQKLQLSPIESKDDQQIFWESSQESTSNDIDSILQLISNTTKEEKQSKSSLYNKWEEEQQKREKLRNSCRKNNYNKPIRTSSSPYISPTDNNSSKDLFELIKLVSKKDSNISTTSSVKAGSFIPKLIHDEYIEEKQIELSPSQHNPQRFSFQSTQTNPEIVKQEIEDLKLLLEDDDIFNDDLFISNTDNHNNTLFDTSNDSNTEDTDSDIGEEDDDDNNDIDNMNIDKNLKSIGINPFSIERTKTLDYIPISKEYQPPLRCLVLEIITDLYNKSKIDYNTSFDENTFSDTCTQKILRVFDENRVLEKVIYLRGSWIDSIIQVGDYINIISWSISHSELLKSKEIIIDNQNNAIVLLPDILIPAKAIGNSIQCSRQAVLSQLVRPSSIITEQILKGEVIHLLFEKALLRKNFSSSFLTSQLNDILYDNLVKIYVLQKDVSYFIDLITPSLLSMQQWAQKNLQGIVKSIQRSNSMLSLTEQSLSKSIRKIIAVEESIWSPLYGIKGKIDATVVYKPMNTFKDNNKSIAVPLELKTGKLRALASGNASDRAQVALYSLLFSERISTTSNTSSISNKSIFPEGLLCYINQDNKNLFPVHTSIIEMQSLIQRRNDIATYLNRQQQYPPLIKNERICKYCNQQSACFIYHKTLENGSPQTSGVSELFINNTEHLSQAHYQFFLSWDKYISLESSHSQHYSSGIWNFPSSHQEDLGLCIGQLKLLSSHSIQHSTPISSQNSSINNDKTNSLLSSFGYLYTFERAIDIDYISSSSSKTTRTFSSSFLPSQYNKTTRKSLLELQLNIGDFVLLSTEHGHFGVRQGTIEKITDTTIVLLLEERLQSPYHSSVFDSFISSNSSNNSSDNIIDIEDIVSSRLHSLSNSTLWRIDKLDSLSIYSRMRNNLFTLLKKGNPYTRLRELIIDKYPPIFKKIEAPCDEFILSWSQQYPSITILNEHQRNAIKHVLAAEDYALILGMPGTGKTSTISHIVATLVSQGKKVLLTSYTHSAIDNLLLKLIDLKINFLRLGKAHKIHPSILPYTLEKYKSMDILSEKLNQQVIATTCLGVGDIILSNIEFDYCIIDEASQINLPICIGPIFLSKVFVLVGDHYQLPPIIKSPEALEAGTFDSLFKVLSECQPKSVIHLGIQYRMNKEIMDISNKLVYNDKLICGSDIVANSKLHLQHLQRLPKPRNNNNHWLHQILFADRSVIFINLDKVPSLEINTEKLITNPREAKITSLITRSFVLLGVNSSDIGIISPYRSQLNVIRNEINKFSGMNKIDIYTVDKYQGKDKDIIIFSLVRNNIKQKVGELLEDWRRANVAFTRAKKKLIILGSYNTLKGNHFFSLFLSHLNNNCIYHLSKNAHKSYSFNDFK